MGVFTPPAMRSPCNEYLLLELIPTPEDDPTQQNFAPERAKICRPAKVVSIGNPTCILVNEKGLSTLVSKSELIPNLKVGQIVYYRKVAEERLTMDGAYREKIDDRDCVFVKITDIVSAE